MHARVLRHRDVRVAPSPLAPRPRPVRVSRPQSPVQLRAREHHERGVGVRVPRVVVRRPDAGERPLGVRDGTRVGDDDEQRRERRERPPHRALPGLVCGRRGNNDSVCFEAAGRVGSGVRPMKTWTVVSYRIEFYTHFGRVRSVAKFHASAPRGGEITPAARDFRWGAQRARVSRTYRRLRRARQSPRAHLTEPSSAICSLLGRITDAQARPTEGDASNRWLTRRGCPEGICWTSARETRPRPSPPRRRRSSSPR